MFRVQSTFDSLCRKNYFNLHTVFVLIRAHPFLLPQQLIQLTEKALKVLRSLEITGSVLKSFIWLYFLGVQCANYNEYSTSHYMQNFLFHHCGGHTELQC